MSAPGPLEDPEDSDARMVDQVPLAMLFSLSLHNGELGTATSPVAIPPQGGDTVNVASCCPVVLPRRAVASPHWFCMEAAVASPQPFWEQLGGCNCSPIQNPMEHGRRGSTTLVAASLGVCSQPQLPSQVIVSPGGEAADSTLGVPAPGRGVQLKLKGEMVLLPEADSLLFIASPVVLNLNELNRKGACVCEGKRCACRRGVLLLRRTNPCSSGQAYPFPTIHSKLGPIFKTAGL